MKSYTVFLFVTLMLSVLMMNACSPSPAPTATSAALTPALASTTEIPGLTALPDLTPTPTQVPAPSASTGQSAVVAFVKDGNILVWEEATGQSRTVSDTGDVIAVTMSDDGQVLAFLRRSVVTRSETDWYEQSALWAMERDGENPRELVPAEELRGRLSASDTDSTNIPQMEWIPGTHRLLYTGWTYFVLAEGESHAIPQGLFLVDAGALTDTVLVPAGTSLRFAPSPDGQLVALTSPTELSFIGANGGDLRQAMFTYPAAGMPGRIIPGGVWAQDSSAFLIIAPAESEPEFDLNFTIWRVPVNGSPAQALATITGSVHDSITFSPDGSSVAFFRGDSSAMVTHSGYFVAPLVPEAGPLAVPRSAYLFWKSLHWSPAGLPYAIHEGSLDPLCPDPAQDSEVCGEGLVLGDQIAEIYWIDETRFVFVTFEPYDLYYGRLDGTRTRIAEGVERFAATALACRNDSEFTAGGEGLADFSAAPDTLFARTWRLRNSGTCAWDSSYRLGFLGGERLSGPHSLPLGETVPTGGEIELSVDLLAPAGPGKYRGEWQLLDPAGVPFGVKPAVEIVVPSFTVTEFAPDQILAEIPADPGPIALGEGALWSLGGNGVSRIDLDTNQVVATIPAGEFPSALAIGYGSVWAAASGIVNRIDPQTNQVSGTISVAPEFGLNDLAAGAGSVWVSSAEEGVVYRIDPNTNQVTASIRVEFASHLATMEDAVWVTNPLDPVLTRIDPETNEVSTAIPLDCSTRMLAVDATAVWVPCDSTPALFRIDPQANQVVARIAVGYHPAGVASGPDAVWVTSVTGNTLTKIDPATNQVTAVYAVGNGPIDVIAAQNELFVKSQDAIWRIRP